MHRLAYKVTTAGLAAPVLVGLDGKTTAALHAAGRPIPRRFTPAGCWIPART
jgi:hypothetical protein